MNGEVEKIKGKRVLSKLVISSEENHLQGLQPKQIPFPFLTEFLTHAEGLIPIIMTAVMRPLPQRPPSPASTLRAPLCPQTFWPLPTEEAEAVARPTLPSLPPAPGNSSLSLADCWFPLSSSSSTCLLQELVPCSFCSVPYCPLLDQLA